MYSINKIALISWGLLATALSSDAIIVAEYDTAASTTNPFLVASSADSSVSVDNLSTGAGLNAANGSTWNWNNWNDAAGATFADAVAANNFWTWGFDVSAANTEVELTSFDVRLDRSGTGPNQFEIQASVNGGAGISLLSFDFGDSDSAQDFIGVDLSTVGTLATGDSIVFTLAAFGADSGGAATVGTFDLETVNSGGSDPRSLRIEGDVSVVPEPNAYALIGGIVVLSFVMLRRGEREV